MFFFLKFYSERCVGLDHFLGQAFSVGGFKVTFATNFKACHEF